MSAVVWSKPNCPFCVKAKHLLETKGVAYEEKVIGTDVTVEDLKAAVPEARTVPQIFLEGNLIGGFTELKKFYDEQAGQA